MKTYPSWDTVKAELGDKVVDAVSVAAHATKADLLTYRQTFPAWVAQSTERGLAAWIHDRLWFHLISELGDVPEIGVVDREPTRELGIGVRYVLRVKRHHEDGRVSTYPTQTALEFLVQPAQEPLDGLEQWNLIVGYVWNKEIREMKSPVISLRDGERIIWQTHLSDDDIGETGVARPTKTGPTAPTIQGPVSDAEKSEDGE